MSKWTLITAALIIGAATTVQAAGVTTLCGVKLPDGKEVWFHKFDPRPGWVLVVDGPTTRVDGLNRFKVELEESGVVKAIGFCWQNAPPPPVSIGPPP